MDNNTVNTSPRTEDAWNEEDRIDLFQLLPGLWKGFRAGWWIPLILAIAVGLWNYRSADRSYTPYYKTSATVYVSMASGQNGTYQDILSAEQMVTFFPYLMQNGVLTDAIETKLGKEGLPGTVDLEADANTNLLTFTVTGSDPEEIHELLLAVLEVFPDTLSYIVGPTEFTLFKDMGIPDEPANAKPSELTFIKASAKTAGRVYLTGLILVLLYGLTIRTISSKAEMKQCLNAVNLGVLPTVKFKKRKKHRKNQLTMDNPRVPFGFRESMRTVRTRFEREAEKNDSRIILVTSTVPGEGKTTTAVNLAMSLAGKGLKILLVDGDMRNPSVAGILQINGKRSGLSEVLTGRCLAEDAIIELPDAGLYVLTAGKTTRRSTDLLSCAAMEDFLEEVREYADYIIIDTPPAMVLGDSMALGKYADGCVYVVRCGCAKRNLVIEGFAQIAENGCRILGTVLNDAAEGSTGYGGRYRNYGKYENYGKYGGHGKYGAYGRYGAYGSYGYGEKRDSK
ncbi:MAG: polysaccharide biosynthesis tyrosine autokinase [Lachnospiraceae bacterium]